MKENLQDGEFADDWIDFYDTSLEPIDLLDEQRFIAEELLAEGSVKKVYRVTDTHCAREVALARIKKEFFGLDYALDFIREVQVTSSLEHPNIVRVYDVGIAEGRPWFTMELASGRNLADKLDDEKLSLSDKIEIFIQLCDAIAYAHKNDILHLDLKPRNVAIGKHGQVLLCDWGVAYSLSQLPQADLHRAQTLQGYIKGSPGFMAPEQAVPGYQKHVAADIFGLTGIFYYMLTGEAPVLGDSIEESMKNLRSGKIADGSHKAIPLRLRSLVRKGLAPDPANRFSSSQELLQEIKLYREGFATGVEEASLLTQIKLFCRRNVAVCFVAIIALGMLMALNSVYVVYLKKSQLLAIQAKDESEKARALAEGEKQRAESQTVRAEAEKLRAESQTVRAEEEKMRAESQTVRAEEEKMRAEDAMLSAEAAKYEAESAREEEQQAKERAEEALQRFRREQQELAQANTAFSGALIDKSRWEMSRFLFTDALQTAKSAYNRRPNSQGAILQLGWTYFSRFEFDKSYQYLSLLKKNNSPDLREIAKKYKDVDIWSDPKYVAEVFHAVKKRDELSRFMFMFHSRRRPRVEHFKLTLAFLQSLNPKAEIEHSFYPRGRKLDLSKSKGLEHYFFRDTYYCRDFCILDGLSLKHLILADTKRNREFKGMIERSIKCTVKFRKTDEP